MSLYSDVELPQTHYDNFGALSRECDENNTINLEKLLSGIRTGVNEEKQYEKLHRINEQIE